MGVDLGDIVAKRQITLESLSTKIIAVDAFNFIFQFLSNIRGPDGSPLRDSKGRITSHLSGLFYRNLKLMQNGIKLIYVFDGKPPLLKLKTLEARAKRREEAFEAWEKAKEAGELEEARIFAKQSASINEEILKSSKEVLELLGIPIIQAPSDGEAQAAYLCKKGIAYAAASQDYDTLVFGTPKLVRNLAITGKRKLPRKNIFVDVEPEEILLEETLLQNKIDQEKLIMIALLIGNDYVDGIKGIGPKTALKIVSKINSLDELFNFLKIKGKTFENEEEVRQAYMLFKEPEVEDVQKEEIFWKEIDEEKLLKFMCDEHDFSEERVQNALKEYKQNKRKQATLF
jgi:flap endonuclease-1